MTDSSSLTASQMRKFLILLNQEVRREVAVPGLAKMKKEQLKTEFDKRFIYSENKKTFIPRKISGTLDLYGPDLLQIFNARKPPKKKAEPKKKK